MNTLELLQGTGLLRVLLYEGIRGVVRSLRLRFFSSDEEVRSKGSEPGGSLKTKSSGSEP